MASGSGTALAVLLLSLLQVFVFGVVFIMPGMLLVTGYLAFGGLGLLLQVAGAGASAAAFLSYAYLLTAVTSLLLHVYFARNGKGNFTGWVWKIRVVLNALTMGVTLITTLGVLILATVAPDAFAAQMTVDGASSSERAMEEVFDARLAGVLGIVYTTTPFFLSRMHSSESFVMMVQT